MTETEGIKLHPHIPPQEFQHLLKIHNATDSIVSLHYSTHSQLITVHQLFDKVSQLLNKKVKLETFLCLFLIDKWCYRLSAPVGVQDYSPCRIALFQPIHQFTQSLQTRREEFIIRINKWIDSHPETTDFDYPDVEDIIAEHKSSKSSKESPTRTNKVTKPKLALKNNSSKFTFKPKDENNQQARNNGLSLLERIKLKETKLKQEAEMETPELKRNHYLQDKLPQIYNILAQLNGENNSSTRSYPLDRLTQSIKDSIDYPIHNEEILDCLKLLESKLSHRVLNITTRNQLSVVKVYRLNRSHDLQLLTKNS